MESTQGNGNSGVPVGTIIIWSTWGNPDTSSGIWLECNGQAVNASLYPKLAALMSYTPNYQGIFLRGYGGAESSHYGSVWHNSAGLGDLQGDAIRNITGSFVADDSQVGNPYDYPANFPPRGAFYKSANAYLDMRNQDRGNNGGWITFDASRMVSTANENRPINKAVRYLIKAT